MTDLTATKTEDTNLEEQSTATTSKTETRDSDLVGDFLRTGVGLTDTSLLSTEELVGLYEELDQTWVASTSYDDTIATVDSSETVSATYEDLVAVGDGLEADADTIAATTSTTEGGVNLIHGDNYDNVIVGTDGKDHIRVYGGQDFAFGLDGDDEILGWHGSDFLFGGRGSDGLYGEFDNDFLFGGRGEDHLQGGDGDDALFGGRGKSTQYGGAGDDIMFGGTNTDLYDGGAGADTVSYELAGGAVTALLWVNGAQDTGQGLDTFVDVEHLIGSDYNDQLSGDSGSNQLEGGAGNDTLDGGAGDDALFGGDGNDVLAGGNGNDGFHGGDGIDTASFTGSASGVVVNLSLGGLPQNTGQGIDTFWSIENVSGSSLSDLIRGDGGNNAIRGNEGGDWIWGAGGNDTILGDDGDDVIVGGAGNDELFGGAGADAFFAGDYFGDGGDDFIYDFEDNIDKVFVDNAFGVSDFSDISIADDGFGNAVANFEGNIFGGSITFVDVSPAQITVDDFVFF